MAGKNQQQVPLYKIERLPNINEFCHAYGWPTGTWCGMKLIDGKCPIHGSRDKHGL